ncbi:6-phosphogluconolactonase [Pseudogemmobacter sonorensis]|uniref:6-phosphogluconolactonase n=1 Tax=Pseudogemmobacter sonorensis TaxID=2989681 RepID=UPI00367BB377
MNFHAYPDRDLMYLSLANTIAGELADFIRREGRATLSVPGGTTPGPVFDILSGVDLDWGLVSVVLNDERWVPDHSDRSNTRLLRERLLQGPAARARLIPLVAPAAAPEQALPDLIRGLEPHLPVSVLLLGMGADMHTASLFPGGEGLAEALSPEAPPLVAMRAEAAVEPRVTLSAPVLRAAFKIHLLITGEAKKLALEQATGLPPEAAPIRVVLDQAEVHWAE